MAIKKGAGRPLKPIDLKNFKQLCFLQCTKEEIAGFFECSPDTIERWCKRELGITFEQAFAEYRQEGRISLRRSQFRLAQKNAAMAIFLGKNWLGQKDTQEIDHSIAPIIIKDDIKE